MKKQKKVSLLFIFYSVVILSFMNAQAMAGTVAYWRFEAGPADTYVIHTGDDGVYYPDIEDVTGNGNGLSVWATGGGGGYIYRSDVANSTVLLTGVSNNLSVQNAGGGPAMWCATTAMQTMTPSAFTIEVTFKLEDGGYRTIVGRDSYGTNEGNTELAALYFQLMPGNVLAFKFCDVDGYWHETVSASNIVTTFDFGTDPDGETAPWYTATAVSDGSILSLYLMEHGSGMGYQLIAQTDISASGSTNTALTAGAGDGGDWDAGDFTVGRGLYGGGHADRAWGFIDEVRISDTALQVSEFLFYEFIPAGIVVTPSDLTLHEEGSTEGDLFFSLEYEPTDSVVLTIEEQHGRSQVTLNQTILTFTTGNWDDPQSIHVTAVDDTDLENAEQEIPLTVTVSSALDQNYDGLEVDPVVVTVLENECGAWGYAPADFFTDCVVDVHDIARFAEGWLDCSSPNETDCTDFSSN